MTGRRVWILGSGGREHALAWRIARDPDVSQVTVAPGNDGIGAGFPTGAIDLSDLEVTVRACREAAPDLVVIGPEAPLAAGLADALRNAAVPTFGPTREAARLESSKAFAKQVMREAGVPTARAVETGDPAEARSALGGFAPPWVIKADGLAAGKGVLVTRDRAEAEAFIEVCCSGERFGQSGRRVLIEEFLEGEEASLMAVCDGERFALLPAARDYKRARDHDEGPNTGGMGALAPHPAVDVALERLVGDQVVAPVLARMRERGSPFQGLLYCGLMLSEAGPQVVEFNARFGDPETQVVLPLVSGSLFDLLASAAAGALDPGAIAREAGAAVAVALVANGYPDRALEPGRIDGLDESGGLQGVTVFHAGTARAEQGWKVTGGRAAYVLGRGADISAARDRAYSAVTKLGGHGWRARHDIAAPVAEPAGRAS